MLLKDGVEIKMENFILVKRVYFLIKNISFLKFGIKYLVIKKFIEYKVYIIILYK